MKQNYLMGIIREEISNYLGENEQMYDSPQTQQREMNKLLDQVEQLKQLRDNLDAQIAQLEATANTFNVNEDAAANKAAADAQRMAIDKKITALNKTKQELSKPGSALSEEQIDEETLNEMPFIGGEKGTELFNAIKSASEKLKDKFPDATAKDISKIILSKKKRPEFAPEVEDALMAQEEKYGDDPKYTANLGGPQTEKAVAKALGEYEPGQRGRKATEKPSAEPKVKKSKSFNPTPITKKTYEPKPVNDLTDDEGNPIEIDTTLKTATGNKELEDKLKDVITKKKAKLAKAEGADYDREVAALKQFLAKPEIAKYIAKKTVNGVNPYSIDSILK